MVGTSTELLTDLGRPVLWFEAPESCIRVIFFPWGYSVERGLNAAPSTSSLGLNPLLKLYANLTFAGL